MRFYAPPESIFPEKNTIEIRDESEVRHIRDAMRLKRGEDVNIFDGTGKEYSGEIKAIDRTSVLIEIKKVIKIKTSIDVNITLYQAIPKKGMMDFIVEKSVELGVTSIVPMLTERTIPILKPDDYNKIRMRIGRWERIAKAAAKQCGRVSLPDILDVMDFNKALIDSKKTDLSILAAVDEEAGQLKDILRASRPKDISVFIGPEGDFSKDEIIMAKKHGFKICSLGSLILRVETAAIYILSSVNYEYI